MKTMPAMILIMVVMSSVAIYLDRYYVAGSISLSDSDSSSKLVNTTDDSLIAIEAQIQKPESLRQPIDETDFHEEAPQLAPDQRAIELDVSELSTLTTGDWITLPLTYGSITLQLKSNDQRAEHKTLIVSDVETGRNSIITITDKAVFGTLTTASGNHQLSALKPTHASIHQSGVFSGTIQAEQPEHELFSQLRESDELFPSAEDLLNQTEHLQHSEHLHHH